MIFLEDISFMIFFKFLSKDVIKSAISWEGVWEIVQVTPTHIVYFLIGSKFCSFVSWKSLGLYSVLPLGIYVQWFASIYITLSSFSKPTFLQYVNGEIQYYMFYPGINEQVQDGQVEKWDDPRAKKPG